MDFADITFTIPKANIFSGIEPCLAVVLASVPLMRPLLGRSVATPHGSGPRPASAQSKSVSPKGVSDDGFERLDDDTSRLWLRPMGLQHADASASRETMAANASEGDEASLDRHEASGELNDRGIRVKQSFHDSENASAP